MAQVIKGTFEETLHGFGGSRLGWLIFLGYCLINQSSILIFLLNRFYMKIFILYPIFLISLFLKNLWN